MPLGRCRNRARQGDALAAGSRVELLSGTAEIVFIDLAHVTLQGPATLEIESNASARLRSGSAMVNNPAAANFEFVTPGMVFTLSSAEFSVELKPNGTEQISVIRGEVAAAKCVPGARIYKNSPGGGPQTPEAGPDRMILTANQSHVIDCAERAADRPRQRTPRPGGRRRDADRWIPSLERIQRQAGESPRFDRLLRFPAPRKAPIVLRNRAATGDKLDGRIEGATWVQGRWPAKGAKVPRTAGIRPIEHLRPVRGSDRRRMDQIEWPEPAVDQHPKLGLVARPNRPMPLANRWQRIGGVGPLFYNHLRTTYCGRDHGFPQVHVGDRRPRRMVLLCVGL